MLLSTIGSGDTPQEFSHLYILLQNVTYGSDVEHKGTVEFLRARNALRVVISIAVVLIVP